MTAQRSVAVLVALVVVSGLILGACAPAEREVIRETVEVETTVEVTEVVEVVTEKEVVVTATPEPTPGPSVGGTMVAAFQQQAFDTLDIHLSGDGNSMAMSWLMGATLVARDTEANYHPWLAESWEVSEDGLSYVFNLREDVTFHDGTPLTAHDFVWTIERLLDPETGAPQAGRMRAVESVEAVDDHTLRLQLASPYPLLLEQLSNSGVVQPYSQAFVEEAGDEFGRTFMGVGPYQFVEWHTGEKVVLDRNPDFNWGPPFVDNQGPYYIETMEFRLIPEYATILAGIEAGEIDYAYVEGKDVERLREDEGVNVFESLYTGMYPSVHMNVSQPPFDDLRVRQALNLAVDRQALVDVVLEGHGQPQYGPLSSNMKDYWPGVEYVGFKHDLEEAARLMEGAGYTAEGGGTLEKDGQPLKLTLQTGQGFTKLAEVLQAQYKALGVDVEIQLIEAGVLFQNLMGGNYELQVTGYIASESDILYRWFHTSREGALNLSHISDDAELDRLLDLTRSTVDPEQRQEVVHQVQEHIVEQAYVVPLYAMKEYLALSTDIKEPLFNPLGLSACLKAYFNDAWIEAE